MPGAEPTLAAAIIACLGRRSVSASICPSDVARMIAPGNWRAFMPAIRTAAAELARTQRIIVTRGTATLHGGDFSGGPIRIRRGPKF